MINFTEKEYLEMLDEMLKKNDPRRRVKDSLAQRLRNLALRGREETPKGRRGTLG